MKPVVVWILALTAVIAVKSQTPSPEYGFLVERVSITTKDGVIGFPAGTRVEVLNRHGTKLSVRTEDRTFEVTSDQITNDSQIAKSLRQQDSTQQQFIRQQLAASAVHVSQEKQKEQQTAHPPPPPDPRVNSDERLNAIRKERERLKIELERVNFEAKDLPPPNSSSGRGRHVKIRSSPNAAALDNKRKDLERRIFDLNQQEKLIKLNGK